MKTYKDTSESFFRILIFSQFQMSTANQDEILSNFIAITQCSNEEATRYLEAANWNAETAMEIFFDNGGSDAGQSIAATPPVPPTGSANQNAAGE